MLDLSSLGHLCMALNERRADLASARVKVGELYCPKCGGVRRMLLSIVHSSPGLKDAISKGGAFSTASDAIYASKLVDSVFRYECVQCDAQFTALIYTAQYGELRLALFSGLDGGVSTPLTPKAVSYYLDQAQRCRSMNANTAAVAMYRAALEQLLLDKGYADGMLDKKIKELEADLAGASPPAWARDLDVEYLKVMKELGNGAIHTNGGDVSKQAALDDRLLACVEKTVHGLLHLAYEEPARKAQNLTDLKRAAAVVKR